MDSKNVLMMDLFLYKWAAFASQDVNWWTGEVWIIVMFLSADSHSDGTHSLQRIIGDQVMNAYFL